MSLKLLIYCIKTLYTFYRYCKLHFIRIAQNELSLWYLLDVLFSMHFSYVLVVDFKSNQKIIKLKNVPVFRQSIEKKNAPLDSNY